MMTGALAGCGRSGPDIPSLEGALSQHSEALRSFTVNFREGSGWGIVPGLLDVHVRVDNGAREEQVLEAVLAAAKELRHESSADVQGDVTFTRYQPDGPESAEFKLPVFDSVPPDETLEQRVRVWVDLADSYGAVAVGGNRRGYGGYFPEVEVELGEFSPRMIEKVLHSFAEAKFQGADEWAWQIQNYNGSRTFRSEHGRPPPTVVHAMKSLTILLAEPKSRNLYMSATVSWGNTRAGDPTCLRVAIVSDDRLLKAHSVAAAFLDRVDDFGVAHAVDVWVNRSDHKFSVGADRCRA